MYYIFIYLKKSTRQNLKTLAMLKKNIVTKFEKTRNATNSGYIMKF